jgi:hypothetical protein
MQHQTFAPETPRQIEARLEQDRKVLTSALHALGAKFTPDALWSNGLSLVKANSASYTQALDRAIRANPFAVALTAVGLAWLILGRRTSPPTDGLPLPGTHTEAVARWEDEGGPVTESLADTPGPDDGWIAEADRLRARAAELTARIDAASRQSMGLAAQLALHRADVFAALTQDIRRVMIRGLDHLTDDARRLALDGRERTYMAHVQRPAGNAKPIRARPLSSGAVLLAAGATLAALLPQSPAENDAFGAPRDHLFDAVRHALRDERDHLAHAVQRIAQTLLAAPMRRTADAASAPDYT